MKVIEEKKYVISLGELADKLDITEEINYVGSSSHDGFLEIHVVTRATK
jgi:hypothetical protein